MEDAVVCGGGPAGLAAALWLGRYRRKTLLLDAGEPRNSSSHGLSGYLTRDGCLPEEITQAAREEISRYEDVTIVEGHASAIAGTNGDFRLTSTEGELAAHRVILATGVQDLLPDLPGFMEHYGRSIFHCSCCDGYEARDEDVLAIGWGEHAAGFALDLLDWGARVTLVTNGQAYEGDQSCEVALKKHDVEIIEERVAELLSDDTGLTGARLDSGRTIAATKAFFSIGHQPRNELAGQIGCRVDGGGYVE